jgi:hypothetical protein
MKTNPALALYLKIKEIIQTSGESTFGFTISGLADMVVPGGSQSAWAKATIANQINVVITMARQEGIFASLVNNLYFQVYENGGGPNSVRAALPFIAQGGRGKGVAGIAFETKGFFLLQACESRTLYNLKVAVVHKAEEHKHYAELGAFPEGAIDRLSEPGEFLKLKQ